MEYERHEQSKAARSLAFTVVQYVYINPSRSAMTSDMTATGCVAILLITNAIYATAQWDTDGNDNPRAPPGYVPPSWINNELSSPSLPDLPAGESLDPPLGAPPPWWTPNAVPGAPVGWSPQPSITGGNSNREPPTPQNNPREPQRGPGQSFPTRRPNPNRQRNHFDIVIPKIQYNHQPEFDYANALAKSILFYEAQRSGNLPRDNRIPWRDDSAMDDGEDNGVDLSGGYYDGGGYIKYGFPMAYTTTILSWGVIRYRRTYKAIGQLEHVLETIRWATDYFLKCKTGSTEFWGQVSDQESDSRYIGTPEKMNYQRRSYRLSEELPGTDLVAETAAALAAASVVFYETDPAYSETLIFHAKELYKFASNFRGRYHDSINPASKAYRSHSGYKDELAWATAWIYRRTGDPAFFQATKRLYKAGKLNSQAITFSWDDKKVGVQMLMAEMTNKDLYKNYVRQFCQWCLPEGRSSYTNKGLLHVADWGPLRYAANAAFICSLAAEMDMNPNQYRLFALEQMHYILGSTGRSYVVGFGVNPPTKYYHRGSYCPTPPEPCPAFSANFDNAHILYGALVGGPAKTDVYLNSIEKREQSSVALDYNAGYQSALAAILDIHIYGQQDRPVIDKAGEIRFGNETIQAPSSEVLDSKEVEIVYRYDDALRKSIIFYESQRSGILTSDNRIPWRSNSGIHDGTGIKPDLVGGYYDGGDYVKYTFPLAFTITTLSWGAIEFSEGYKEAKQLLYVLGGIKWGTDYLMNCQFDEYSIVAQVGNPTVEAMTWDRPEYMNSTYPRPVTTINTEAKGSDVAAEIAAAFAAASLAFGNNLDGRYRNDLIDRAKELFTFAENYPGVYTSSLLSAGRAYNSTGYNDELAWAALWIYKATNDTSYLSTSRSIYNNYLLRRPHTFSYDDKTAGVHLLMAEIMQDTTYIAEFCNWVVKEAKTTPLGLLNVDKIPTKHAANIAFILLTASQKFSNHPDASSWKFFARDQIHYLLGSTGQSYVVGYGNKFPQQPYHKASSCPRIPLPCGFSYKRSSTPNPQILVGALVAGPDWNDTFLDLREMTEQSAVSLDTNAGFQSAVAGMLHLEKKGILNGAPGIHHILTYKLPLSIILTLGIFWTRSTSSLISMITGF